MTDARPLPEWDTTEKDAERARWQTVTAEAVFETPWIRVEKHKTTAPTGRSADYGLIRFKARAVGVLPLHEDGTVTLVGQMRYPFNAYSWEMPEGGVPFGEAVLEGAKRELGEEAGLKAEHWREILNFDISNSVTNEMATCFLAWGLSAGETAPDETELLETVRIPFKDVLNAVISGAIRDSLTVVTVLRVFHMAATDELPEALSRLIR
ncbi:MAG: NUDIX hydrolase [Asticcacaulis sp.]